MSVSMVSDSARSAAATRSGGDWWSREIELVNHLRSLREAVAQQIGGSVTLPAVEWDVPWRSAETISALTHLCIEQLRKLPGSEIARAQQLCDLVLGLQQLAMDWYLHDTAMRGQRLADCAAGLSRLRGVNGSASLLENACRELVLRCGFHRAVLSQVESRGWKPLMLHDRSAATTGSWFSDWINQTVPLVDDAPEAEMLSRRRPSLVYDTANAPVYRPLIVQAGQSRSYVVAPLVHGKDVVGFLHTDHHPLTRRVDEADRDVAWAFADGFSHLYERAVLVERLKAQRDSVRELFFGAVDRIDELCESGLEATRHAEMTHDDSTGTNSGRAPVGLTEREADVFGLMVTGASNQEIADRLVITEGTVKSHVKHILRKYGAVNRAQAIAWALNGS
ncbi:LuxR C-terminal-related transcriptional regulator [Mycolicibacterium pyrenivorans]|uniref:LuxR C-terminal-related transcriptional regulator n=1 Tax=Mycolicibacterium pyrenivorans TaxID=187102 RepID=UPI0021F2F400|nr:LuxR C-terminal-related transcriptional regulator [Mycolicibacterium pyrenivorans]MCV7154897.1 GAF domain-containing protein [Mycolicibacterium pyrenivorans]